MWGPTSIASSRSVTPARDMLERDAREAGLEVRSAGSAGVAEARHRDKEYMSPEAGKVDIFAQIDFS